MTIIMNRNQEHCGISLTINYKKLKLHIEIIFLLDSNITIFLSFFFFVGGVSSIINQSSLN